MTPLLQTKQLAVGYSAPLFQHLSIALFPGRLTCLLGRNGAGKSTIIKTLAGLIPPISGEVWLNDHLITKLSEIEIAKNLSVVLTHSLRISYMTIFDLAAFGRMPYTGAGGRLSEEDKTIINNALETVGIAHLKDRLLETLSDGECQKAALAKALSQQTRLMLLDEPVAFLDFPAKMEMMYILQNLTRAHQQSILLSTHDLEMALEIADDLLIIDNQRNIISGTPQQLMEDGTIARVFNTQKVKFDNHSRRFCFLKDEL